MRTIAIINQKGGCGKTTTAINLAGITAKRGFRTLLVDMDPQSHCAAGLAIPEQRIDLDIGDALVAEQPIDHKRLLWRASRNLDLAPSRMKLAGLEAARGGLSERSDKEQRLAAVLRGLSRNYDICFIDCSPSIGLLTYNALHAATEVLIPVETSFFSLQGATKQVNTIKTLSKRLGSEAPFWLVATIHDESSALARDLLDELRRRFDARVAPVVVRRDATLKEAASFGQPVVEYSPTSTGAQDYSALADWVISTAHISADSRPREPESLIGAPEEVFPTSQTIVEDKPVVEIGSGLSAAVPPPPQSPWTSDGGVAVAVTPSRAEEMAQRARVLLLKRADEHLRNVAAGRPASSPAVVQPSMITEPKAVFSREGEARARAQSLQDLMGARVTRSGVLFVQPITQGISLAVAGDFNSWTPVPMRRNESLAVFELCLPIAPGRRQYRLVIDGRWVPDSFNPVTEPNPFGELNSVIDVPMP